MSPTAQTGVQLKTSRNMYNVYKTKILTLYDTDSFLFIVASTHYFSCLVDLAILLLYIGHRPAHYARWGLTIMAARPLRERLRYSSPEQFVSQLRGSFTGLPFTRHKWIHLKLTQARQAGTRFSYPRGIVNAIFRPNNSTWTYRWLFSVRGLGLY